MSLPRKSTGRYPLGHGEDIRTDPNLFAITEHEDINTTEAHGV
ncbi:hypothetical protein ACSCBZ_41895 [Streptomyces niveiscabiei]|nr:hypothetical protein [Streptomyces niveiscabiei]